MNYTTNKDIIDNRMDEIRHIGGTTAEIVAAFRGCKVAKAEIRGKFRLDPTDTMKGLNIRKSDLTDADAVSRVFKPFASMVKSSLARPFFDEKRGAVVSTDGVSMLICDIPEGLTVEKAKGSDFHTDAIGYPDWTIVLNGSSRENTPYALIYFDKICEVTKGSIRHNTISLAGACSRAYRHEDNKGLWQNLYLWVGKYQIDAVRVSEMVDAMFRLGCEGVSFFYPEYGYSYKPMHVVGIGDGLNARGLLMPMRFPSTEHGGVELPLNEKAAKAA